jgi:hypothetical protein
LKVSKTKHIKITKIVDDQLGPSKQDYSSLGIHGIKPQVGFLIFDGHNKTYKGFTGQKILFLASVDDFRTFEPDDELQNLDRFNREVNVDKAVQFLNLKEPNGNCAGFNYDYCGIIIGTLKKDSKTGEWYIFVNQGQHRIAMAYLSMGKTGQIPVLVEVPDESHDEEYLLMHEARLHHVDAAVRTGQKIVDKLRSAYICHEPSAESIVGFYDSVGVNVANLLPYEKSCNSWADIVGYIDKYGEDITYRSMSAISKYCNEKTLHAKAIGGLVALGYFFEDKVAEFETLNDMDFFETVCRYAFEERPRIVKMTNLTKNSGNQKHIAWPMTLWINLVNDMIDAKSYKKKGNGNFWITKTSKVWQNYLESELQDDPLVEALNQKVEPNVI